MHRWPYSHTVRYSSQDLIAADLTLGAPGPNSGPLVAAGTSPHRIITPSDSLSCMRAAGTLCVAATLNRVENDHQGLLTLSSCSTSPRSGITIRSHIPHSVRPRSAIRNCQRNATWPLSTDPVSAFAPLSVPV